MNSDRISDKRSSPTTEGDLGIKVFFHVFEAPLFYLAEDLLSGFVSMLRRAFNPFDCFFLVLFHSAVAGNVSLAKIKLSGRLSFFGGFSPPFDSFCFIHGNAIIAGIEKTQH